MFQNQQNNREVPNTNTRGIQLMNAEGFEPSTVLLGFWNDVISIKMHPALDKSKQTDGRVYDYDQAVNTILNIEKAELLIKGIEEVIIPAIKSGEDKNVSALIGNAALVTVGVNKGKTYLAIYKNLDEKSKKAEVSIHYEFKKIPAIVDYDKNTGEFDLNKDFLGELDVFLRFLKNAVLFLTNASSHNSRYVDKYYRDRVLNDIQAIGTKVGAELTGKKFKNKSDMWGLKEKEGKSNVDRSDYVETIDTIEGFEV